MVVVKRMPPRLRVVHEVSSLSQFVILGPGALGDFGWLRQAEALLIGGGEQKGHILLAAFLRNRPLRFQGECINVSAQMPPEMSLAAAALRKGMSLEGYGLYTKELPYSSSLVFFGRAGVTNFWYAHAKVTPNDDTITRLGIGGIQLTRVEL
ncbi:MAG: hypothetical protein NUV60_02010 [Patescibacteria group bacterium]|nr:hypothetical protein [Patescibacteria group bacterium]